MEQRSEVWFAARLGKVTASKVSDVMAKTKSGYAAVRKNYMMDLLCERLTGRKVDTYTNAAMQRGTDLEPQARATYELITGLQVVEVGLVDHPHIPMFGASPDGLVDDDGLLEIKCPNTATHVEFIQTQKPEGKYILQMQVQMMCTGRKWCDFVSYDDRLPVSLQFAMVRIEADVKMQAEIEVEVKKFLDELKEIEVDLVKRAEVMSCQK